MAKTLDLVLVSESDHFLPDQDSSTHPYTFGPLTDYFTKPLGRLGLPFQYHLPNTQSLAIVALGTYLRRQGLCVETYDNVFRILEAQDAFLKALERLPTCVGISTGFLMHPESIQRIVGWVRARSPDSVIVLGGFNAERNQRIRELADITVVGTGERTMTELVTALRQETPLRNVPNLIFPSNGTWISTPFKQNLPLEDIPPPDWDLLNIRPSLYYSIEASKGCRFTCAFCSYSDKGNQRMKPIPQVIHEIRRNYFKYGIRHLRFIDANLTSWPEHTEALCDAILETGIPLQWSCFARADDFLKKPPMAARMRKAGCLWVFCGIESGCDELLIRMRKGYAADAALQGVRIAREAGLYVHGSFIIGFPGETQGTIDETMEFIARSSLDTIVFTVLAVTEELDHYAEQYRDRATGLHRDGQGWVHDTMSYDEAREAVSRCMETVTQTLDNPLVTPYGITLYYLLGNGFTMEESLGYLRAFRDYHRAERSHDRINEENALWRIGRDYQRMLKNMSARLPSPSPFMGAGHIFSHA